MDSSFGQPPIIYKTKDGIEAFESHEYPSEGLIGWRENGNGVREMVRWDFQFGAWLNKEVVVALRIDEGSVTPPWDDVIDKEKPECSKSSTRKHVWERTEEDRQKWPRGDWGCVPGDYCIHCGVRKKA